MDQDYKLMFINVDISESEIIEINMKNLPENWKSIESYPVLQKIGSDWYKTKKSLLLKVPSVIVPWESNYLINTQHPDFQKKVSLHNVEDFIWDRRIL